METRIIKTKFWQDQTVQSMSEHARLLFIYLLTCPYIGKTGMFELSDRYITLETGISEKNLLGAKKELQEKNKVFFRNGWIYVLNAIKHNRYNIGEKTAIGYKREYDLLPKDVVEYYNKINDSTINTLNTNIDTTINEVDSTKAEGINNKIKIINNNINTKYNYNKENTEELPQKEENKFTSINDLTPSVCAEIATKYKVEVEYVENVKDTMENWLKQKGKRYKDYKAGLSNWVKANLEKYGPKKSTSYVNIV